MTRERQHLGGENEPREPREADADGIDRLYDVDDEDGATRVDDYARFIHTALEAYNDKTLRTELPGGAVPAPAPQPVQGAARFRTLQSVQHPIGFVPGDGPTPSALVTSVRSDVGMIEPPSESGLARAAMAVKTPVGSAAPDGRDRDDAPPFLARPPTEPTASFVWDPANLPPAVAAAAAAGKFGPLTPKLAGSGNAHGPGNTAVLAPSYLEAARALAGMAPSAPRDALPPTEGPPPSVDELADLVDPNEPRQEHTHFYYSPQPYVIPPRFPPPGGSQPPTGAIVPYGPGALGQGGMHVGSNGRSQPPSFGPEGAHPSVSPSGAPAKGKAKKGTRWTTFLLLLALGLLVGLAGPLYILYYML